jgi:DNA-3-methyladenine glycosylase I
MFVHGLGGCGLWLAPARVSSRRSLASTDILLSQSLLVAAVDSKNARYRLRTLLRAMTMPDKPRCSWATTPAMIAYHDAEWGVPQHEDRVLFEFLILEGAQAGLSWSTILAKREAYRKAFSGFDAARIAAYKSAKIELLLANPGIVRNRLKIESAVRNAQAFLRVQKEFTSFDRYIRQFVGGSPITNSWRYSKNVPAETAESAAMSKDLKCRGFNFVGPTVCYAFMQATGMVNDHLLSCFRHAQVGGRGR